MKMMKRQWNRICKASKSALWLKVREKEHTLNMNWDFFSSLKTYCCNSLLPASVDTITHPPGLARNLSYPCHPSTAGKFLFSSTSSACPVHYISQISPIYPPTHFSPLSHCPSCSHILRSEPQYLILHRAADVIFLNWGVVAWQRCAGFSCMMKWISHMHNVYPPDLALPSTLYSIPLGHHRAPSWDRARPTSYLFHTGQYTCANPALPVCPTHPHPCCIHKPVLYICISIPALPICTIFLDSTCVH